MRDPRKCAPLAAAAAITLLAGLGACAKERRPEPPASTPEPTAAGLPSAGPAGSPSQTPSPANSAGASPSAAPTALANACPSDGCQVRIASVSKADNGELVLDLEANYVPSMSGNHFHIYWDSYSSKEVSDDAESRFGMKPGVWVPTDQDPYTTGDEVAVAERDGSTHLCVTAGDSDHFVVDEKLFQCTDVGSFL